MTLEFKTCTCHSKTVKRNIYHLNLEQESWKTDQHYTKGMAERSFSTRQ